MRRAEETLDLVLLVATTLLVVLTMWVMGTGLRWLERLQERRVIRRRRWRQEPIERFLADLAARKGLVVEQ